MDINNDCMCFCMHFICGKCHKFKTVSDTVMPYAFDGLTVCKDCFEELIENEELYVENLRREKEGGKE